MASRRERGSGNASRQSYISRSGSRQETRNAPISCSLVWKLNNPYGSQSISYLWTAWRKGGHRKPTPSFRQEQITSSSSERVARCLCKPALRCVLGRIAMTAGAASTTIMGRLARRRSWRAAILGLIAILTITARFVRALTCTRLTSLSTRTTAVRATIRSQIHRPAPSRQIVTTRTAGIAAVGSRSKARSAASTQSPRWQRSSRRRRAPRLTICKPGRSFAEAPHCRPYGPDLSCTASASFASELNLPAS